MNITNRAEKVDEKMGSFVQFRYSLNCLKKYIFCNFVLTSARNSFPYSLPVLSSLNCLKKYIFFNFVLISARHPSLLKQFTQMHLKGLVSHFQKTVLFVVLLCYDLLFYRYQVLKSKNFVKFLLSQHFFDTLIENIS